MWTRLGFRSNLSCIYANTSSGSSAFVSLKKFLGDAESRDKFEYIDERTAHIKKLHECTSHYDLCDQGTYHFLSPEI